MSEDTRDDPKPDGVKGNLGGIAKLIGAIAAIITALGGVGVSVYTAWSANNKANAVGIEADMASASVFNILKARIEKLEAAHEDNTKDHTDFRVDLGVLKDRTRSLVDIRGHRPTMEKKPVSAEKPSTPECRVDAECAGYHVCNKGLCVEPAAPVKKPTADAFKKFEDVKDYYQAEQMPWGAE